MRELRFRGGQSLGRGARRRGVDADGGGEEAVDDDVGVPSMKSERFEREEEKRRGEKGGGVSEEEEEKDEKRKIPTKMRANTNPFLIFFFFLFSSYRLIGDVKCVYSGAASP